MATKQTPEQRKFCIKNIPKRIALEEMLNNYPNDQEASTWSTYLNTLNTEMNKNNCSYIPNLKTDKPSTNSSSEVAVDFNLFNGGGHRHRSKKQSKKSSKKHLKRSSKKNSKKSSKKQNKKRGSKK